MPQPPSQNSHFSLLIVEDERLDDFVKAIKHASAGRMMFNIHQTEFGAEAQKVLENFVCPFISLDQRLSWQRDGDIEATEVSDKSGRRLTELVHKLQPLHCSAVITQYPEWQESRQAVGYGFDYLDKRTTDIPSYAKHLLNRILTFVSNDAWIRAHMILPISLAQNCHTYSDPSAHNAERFEAMRRFWETGILLAVLVLLKTTQHLGGDIKDLICSLASRHGQSRFENDACLRTFESYLPPMLNLLEEKGFSVQAREFRRFFNDNYHHASRSILQLRNATSHSSVIEGVDRLLVENQATLLWFLLGSGFWALHPLSSDLVLEPHLNRMAVRGKSIRGMTKSLGAEIWQWDQQTILHKDRIYQCVVDPLDSYRALLVDLHPLVRCIRSPARYDHLVIAYNPLRDEYIDPQDGHSLKKPFNDDELSKWWRSHISK